MQQPKKEEFDVVIIGYGPAGATLANLLGQSGVRVLVLEREAATYHLPRAVHFDDEVMRVFQSIGLANKISEIVRINPGMRFVNSDNELLLDWPRPKEIGKYGWHPSFRVHQPDLEDILRKGIERYPNITVRARCEAFNIEDQAGVVSIRYEDMSEGRIHQVQAKYVVGCDGARSLVRRYIDTPMEDYGFHERWLVVDVLLNKPKPELGDFSIQYCNPERPATYVRGPENRRRWEITVLPEEDSAQICTPDAVWDLLSDWLKPSEAVLERAAVYVFHSLIAEKWNKGRLFLAGDAAHQTPPFMGQGMCAGIRDVANLAWKMALVVNGKSDNSILDTYQSERHPNAREFIETAVRLGGLINTCGTEDALRKAFPQRDGSAKMDSILPPIGPGLGKGEHAGKYFAQPKMDDGQWMDDVVGPHSVLIVDTTLADNVAFPKDLAVVTTADSSEAAQYLHELGAEAVLLRPDRYIQSTASDLASLNSLVEMVLPSSKLKQF